GAPGGHAGARGQRLCPGPGLAHDPASLDAPPQDVPAGPGRVGDRPSDAPDFAAPVPGRNLYALVRLAGARLCHPISGLPARPAPPAGPRVVLHPTSDRLADLPADRAPDAESGPAAFHRSDVYLFRPVSAGPGPGPG